MKNILILISRFDSFGGVEVLVLNIVKYLKNDFNFIISAFKDGSFRNLYEEQGIKTVIFKDNIDFIKYLVGNKIDIIHTHEYYQGFIGRLIGKFFGKKVISTYHVSYHNLKYPMITFLLTRLTLFLADRITFVSKHVEDAFYKTANYNKKNMNKHFVINNGINLEEINEVLKCWQIIRAKRPELSYKGYKYKSKNLKVFIFGDGELKEDLNRLIYKYNHLEQNNKNI